MTKKILFAPPILFFILALSGCSQEPAEETTQNKKMGDYSYLSRAISQGATGDTARAAQSASGKTPAIPPAPQVSAPKATNGETSTNTPAPTPEKPLVLAPAPPEEKKVESLPSRNDDLSFIKKYDGATIKTDKGDIKIKFYSDDAPKTVNNFFKLASEKFYDGIRFHRVIEGFIIQAGDPNSKDDNWEDDGTGGPGYTVNDEINSHKLIEGSVAMANSGPNTNGSQFFIVTAKSTPLLDGKYTNFGEVTDGMDVVRKIEKVDTDPNDHPTENIEIKSINFIKKK
jgi:peptidyl-prolyl cis-trans isomerase B (cyclophilin B)